jgi:superfamily II DNA helicase RecQ
MDILKSTKMIKLGLKSLVINSDTYSDAQQNGRDLWDEVREGFTMVLLSPEELASRGFFKLLEDARFSDRISSLGVDEVHLIYWWGKSLRPAFRRLGNVRARLPLKNGQRVPVLGITATLRVGEPMECVQQVLGLVPGQYRFIRGVWSGCSGIHEICS